MGLPGVGVAEVGSQGKSEVPWEWQAACELLVSEAKRQLRARCRRRHLRAWYAAMRAARCARARARRLAERTLRCWRAQLPGWQLEAIARAELAMLAHRRALLLVGLHRLADWRRTVRARQAWRLRALCNAPRPPGAFAAAGLRWAGAARLRARGPDDAQPYGLAAAASLATLRHAAVRCAALHETGRAVWRLWRAYAESSAAQLEDAIASARGLARSRLRAAWLRVLGSAAMGAQRALAATACRRQALRRGGAALRTRVCESERWAWAPQPARVNRRWALRRWAAAIPSKKAENRLRCTAASAADERAAARALTRLASAAKAGLRSFDLDTLGAAGARLRRLRAALTRLRQLAARAALAFDASDRTRWRAASRALRLLMQAARAGLSSQMRSLEAVDALPQLARRAALCRWRTRGARERNCRVRAHSFEDD